MTNADLGFSLLSVATDERGETQVIELVGE